MKGTVVGTSVGVVTAEGREGNSPSCITAPPHVLLTIIITTAASAATAAMGGVLARGRCSIPDGEDLWPSQQNESGKQGLADILNWRKLAYMIFAEKKNAALSGSLLMGK